MARKRVALLLLSMKVHIWKSSSQPGVNSVSLVKNLPKLGGDLDSPLAIDMSVAILQLSENGDLQRIHDKRLTRSACSSQGAKQ
ncbi:hypothetical protein Ddye_010708 [Dipteronia dyeriana]|uniref:Uncharacterized protein n=1 Tax=Dipteronia dyeriana TaxID=168575 RepID=A0AAE0CNI9_9ROSI|nr:hypothetical protein Ddye_010708 [Dipteronia dyeriana]